MIELPEAKTIAGQVADALTGKTIAEGDQGNWPHKFAFYTKSAEEYEAILPGKTVNNATFHGSFIVVPVEPGYVLALGYGGEKILLHETEATLPAKRQLLLRFTDGTYLTVSITGWGELMLLTESEAAVHGYLDRRRISPLDDRFTFDYFLSLMDGIGPEDARPVKSFMISKPGVLGVGNGYTQDILFRAKLHPRTRIGATTTEERHRLYEAVKQILKTATAQGGRDTERDLYNQPGKYVRMMDSRTVGTPCPECGTPIEKISFLGGACYLCGKCQS